MVAIRTFAPPLSVPPVFDPLISTFLDWARVERGFSLETISVQMTTRSFPQSYVRTLRIRAGLTQRDLAFLMGYHGSSQISRFETGERQPRVTELFMLEMIFDAAGRFVFPKWFEKTGRTVAARVEELQRRDALKPGRISAPRASYKSGQLSRILESIRRRLLEVKDALATNSGGGGHPKEGPDEGPE